MAFDIFVTEAAHEDLEEALGYIAGDLANPGAAKNLLDETQAVYEQLKDFPMLYECCHDLRLHNLGYRKVVIGNFVMVYHPMETEQRVYILRFFYGGRDYEKLI
ncbi:MAG: type II toxin-antitoxin system RelE/ParE family toxin [Oscillospiraceae bacterium]|nr:type II toxin-antitoxin system RelE/ParE family toxin [Oscillospiraceae bacterium]